MIILYSADRGLVGRWLEGIKLLDDTRLVTDRAALERSVQRGRPAVILADLQAPGIDDVDGAVDLCQRHPDLPFLFLSPRPEGSEGLRLVAAGARGYGNRYMSPELLRKAVGVVRLGEVWLGRQLLQRLIRSALPTAAEEITRDGLSMLTAREQEIARLVADGASNKRIGSRLDITERTVKAHLSAIFRKTGTRDRLQLALLVKSGGMVASDRASINPAT